MRRKLHVGDEPVAGESALVGGRRPGYGEAVVFDETAVEAEPGGCQRGIGRKTGPKRVVATEGVRGNAARSARGRRGRSREARREGVFDRDPT